MVALIKSNFEVVYEQPIIIKSGIPVDGYNFLRAFINLKLLPENLRFESAGIFDSQSLRPKGKLWKYQRRIWLPSKSENTVCFYQQIPPKPIFGNSGKSRVKNIYRVHDFFPKTRPELYTRKQRIDFRRRILSLQNVDYLIFNSLETQKEYDDLFQLENVPYTVVECLTPSFAYNWLDFSSTKEDRCKRLEQLEPGFILAISPLIKRKRTLQLVEFWLNQLKVYGIRLVLVSSEIPGNSNHEDRLILKRIEQHNNELTILSNLCSQCVAMLYLNARGFISNSAAEGFNMPLKDARFFQLPVLAPIPMESTSRRNEDNGGLFSNKQLGVFVKDVLDKNNNSYSTLDNVLRQRTVSQVSFFEKEVHRIVESLVN